MNMTSTDGHRHTVNLCVPIDEKRANLLYDNAGNAADIDHPAARFSPLIGDDIGHPSVWAEGTLFWCQRSLEAIVLAAYETACGFAATILSDECWRDPDEPGYVVLSSRAFDCYWGALATPTG